MASFREVEWELGCFHLNFSRWSRAALGLFDPTQLDFFHDYFTWTTNTARCTLSITSICLVVDLLIPRHRRSAHLPPDAVVGRSPPRLHSTSLVRDRPRRLAGHSHLSTGPHGCRGGRRRPGDWRNWALARAHSYASSDLYSYSSFNSPAVQNPDDGLSFVHHEHDELEKKGFRSL
jgi:hypothetical protein